LSPAAGSIIKITQIGERRKAFEQAQLTEQLDEADFIEPVSILVVRAVGKLPSIDPNRDISTRLF
jgi:hypothetical protein